MITSIRSNPLFIKRNNTQVKSSYTQAPKMQNISYDSVSFSGKTIPSKLSQESIDLVQNFAKKLQLNKIYKFENPNVEKFKMTSIASTKNSDTRMLLLQYFGYSKNNMTKHIMCTIKDTGEIFESGTPIKNPKEIALYENIIPALINHASKELKIKI